MDKTFHSAAAPPPVGHYPHARRVGGLLYLSGVGPRKPDSKEIPGVTLNDAGEVTSYDIAVQTRSVFENVEAILASAGLGLADLVDVTVFLTDMRRDFPAFNRLWAERFPENPPCRTTVEVWALPTPIAVELKCIAAWPED
ncbi:MAG: RidA family protein [Gammaproteobacteria bacterium]